MSKVRWLIVLLVLSGCVNPGVRELQLWSTQQRELAETGQVLWSDYYRELYTRIASSDVRQKATAMERANLLLEAAVDFESGKIDSYRFASLRRLVAIEEQQETEQRRGASYEAIANAMRRQADRYAEQAARQQQATSN